MEPLWLREKAPGSVMVTFLTLPKMLLVKFVQAPLAKSSLRCAKCNRLVESLKSIRTFRLAG